MTGVPQTFQAWVDSEPESVISANDRAAFEILAAELQKPNLSPEKRTEIVETGLAIAVRYQCDLRRYE
jgi:hypothetical protein